MKQLLMSLWFVVSVHVVLAAGFGLSQPSARSEAMGGVLVGRAVDASANFWNPATLSDLTNLTLSIGFVTEHPRARIKTNDGAGWGTSTLMDSGCFVLPSFQFAVPLPWDFVFGFGCLPEYGLGSNYGDWDLKWSSKETTIQSFTVNPNLSYSILDDWSVAVGIRAIWWDFEQISNVQGTPYETRLKGDNHVLGFGWQVGTRYRILDNLAAGVLFRSAADIRVNGRITSDIPGYADNPSLGLGRLGYGRACCNLRLPPSVALGLNWDVTPTVHTGFSATWTRWSTVEKLRFELPAAYGGTSTRGMRWDDTWRFAVGLAWDFAEDWTWMGSYFYDMDCSGSQQPTMLPPADRHALAMGLAWNIGWGVEAAFSYSLILMNGGEMTTKDAVGRTYRVAPHRGLSHSVGFTLTYRF